MAPPKKYPQIAEQIINEIKYGNYRVGSEFPNLDDMAKIYKISRATAFRALSILVKEGYVSVGRGRKSVVIAREKTLNLRKNNISGTIAILADFNTDASMSGAMKMIYAVQHELKAMGNHVVCFQYCNNIELRPNDIDAYILFDMFGIHGKYREMVHDTGKPYVRLCCVADHFIRPNHIHLLYKIALLEFSSYLLRNKSEKYVFFVQDMTSAGKGLDDTERRKIDGWVDEEILEPLIDTLKQHGCKADQVTIVRLDSKGDTARKTVENILSEVTPGTGIVTVSENSALDIFQSMKKRGMLPGRDYHIGFVDSICTSNDNNLQNLNGVKLELSEILSKVIKSLDYQLVYGDNFAPGCIVSAGFEA